MKTGIVYDPIYLKHDTGTHVENSRRLEAIIARLEQTGLMPLLTPVKPRPATLAELALVHDESLITRIREAAASGGAWLDPDTFVSADSYDAALYAAGGAIEAVATVMGGQVNNAFALVRPPGHHATRRQAMGFCLFNNIAVAARHAQVKSGLERIAIIDFDVHHGNGTQAAFDNDCGVLYVSTHQSPHYPGTGSLEDTGSGPAAGTKVNVPLPAGCGDAEYGQVYEQIIVPAVRRFQPQLILVSAGYDGHWKDELADMRLTVTGFARIAAFIKGLADELCQGRLVLCLEGGYHLEALAASVKATFDVLLGETVIDDPPGKPPHPSAPNIGPLLNSARKLHRLS